MNTAVLPALLAHLRMTFIGVALAAAFGIPISALMMKNRTLNKVMMIVIDVIQTIPTLAMLTFVMLIFGLNENTVIASVFLYSLFPVIRNTYVGITSVDPGIVRAGRGIGMTKMQLFTRIRIPLGMPMILTGIRLAIISALGIATTGVFIGAGGLGMLIWRGIQTKNLAMMLKGSIPVSLLAVLFEQGIGIAEKNLKKERRNS